MGLTSPQIENDVTDLINEIESGADEAARRKAIRSLAAIGDVDSCRILIETFHLSMWRETKIELLRAIASTHQRRGTEFIFQVIADSQDLGLAAEAMLALSETGHCVAGELLLNYLKDSNHGMTKEAIIALSGLDLFPCEPALLESLLHKSDMSPGIVQYIILGLAQRRYHGAWPVIEGYLAAGDSVDGRVFNASLIAAGHLAPNSGVDLLDSLDLRYKFFAESLKRNAMTEISERADRRIEDALSLLAGNPSPARLRSGLFALKFFNAQEAWDAFKVLIPEASLSLEAMVRTTLLHKGRVAEDVKFVCDNALKLQSNDCAKLLHRHKEDGTLSFDNEEACDLPQSLYCTILTHLYAPTALDRLLEIVITKTTDPSIQVEGINAIVNQGLLAVADENVKDEAGQKLMAMMDAELPDRVRLRAIRALGQLAYDVPEVYTVYRDSAAHGQPGARNSVFYALSHYHNEPSQVVMRKLLKHDILDENELQVGLGAFGRMLGNLPPGKVADVDFLDHFPKEMRPKVAKPLLKILSLTKAKSYGAFIEDHLKSSQDFQTTMLAIAAAKFNYQDSYEPALKKLLQSPNPCLSGRALDTLSMAGSATLHLELLDEEFLIAERVHILKLVRSLVPRKGGDYGPFIENLEELLRVGEGAFSEPDVTEACSNLIDNLKLFGHDDEPLDSVFGVGMGQRAEQHRLDEELAKELPQFPIYSETMKSILRNAELTHRYPELFDERVDKSTLIVEIVKSLDLLLQERIGNRIFLAGEESELFRQMRSRVVGLGLEDETVTTKNWLMSLRVGRRFSGDTFPTHKMRILAAGITSGKILRDQYRMIDGLRAWSVLLLLFGRNFRFGKSIIEPLFPMENAESNRIARLASNLNRLQHVRNEAAHRGTMLKGSQLLQLREDSFAVLKELSQLIKPI